MVCDMGWTRDVPWSTGPEQRSILQILPRYRCKRCLTLKRKEQRSCSSLLLYVDEWVPLLTHGCLQLCTQASANIKNVFIYVCFTPLALPSHCRIHLWDPRLFELPCCPLPRDKITINERPSQTGNGAKAPSGFGCDEKTSSTAGNPRPLTSALSSILHPNSPQPLAATNPALQIFLRPPTSAQQEQHSSVC